MPYKPAVHRPAGQPARDDRPSASKRGYGAAWRRLRAVVLAEKPVCEGCGRESATDVDHKIRRGEPGGTDDMANLVALCHRCHSIKTVQQDGGFGRRKEQQ